jgi:hypothetical protein
MRHSAATMGERTNVIHQAPIMAISKVNIDVTVTINAKVKVKGQGQRSRSNRRWK